MDCLPIIQFSLDFILRSKTYLKEHPSSASIANRDFPLSSLREDDETGLYTLQAATCTAALWFTLVLGA